MAKYSKDIGQTQFTQGPTQGVVDNSVANAIKLAGEIAYETHAGGVRADHREVVESVLKQREDYEESKIALANAQAELADFESDTGGADEEFFDDPALKQARRTVAKYQRAADQKRLSPQAAKMKIDAFTKQAINQYPHLRKEIEMVTQEETGVAGFGSLYSRMLLGVGQGTQEKSLEQRAQESLYMDAVKKGFQKFDVNGKPDVARTNADYTLYLAKGAQAEQERKAYEAQSKQRALSQEERAAATNNLYNRVDIEIQAKLGGLDQAMATIVTGLDTANISDANLQRLENLQTGIVGLESTMRSWLWEQVNNTPGLDYKDKSEQVELIMKNRFQPLLDMYTHKDKGLLARMHRLRQTMEERLGMSALQAAPFIAQLSKVSGGDRVIANLVNMEYLTRPQFEAGIKRELSGLLMNDQERSKLRMANYIQLTTGEKTINQMSQEEKVAAYKDAFTSIESDNAVSELSLGAQDNWGRDTAAVWSFVPGASVADAQKVVDVASHPTFRQHLNNLKGRDKLIYETVSDTMNSKYPVMLEAMQRELLSSMKDEENGIVFNRDTGKYQFRVSPEQIESARQSAANIPKMQGAARTKALEQVKSIYRPSADDIKKLDTMNKILDLSTITGDSDPLLAGLNNKERRQYMAQAFTPATERKGKDYLKEKWDTLRTAQAEQEAQNKVKITSTDELISAANQKVRTLQRDLTTQRGFKFKE